MKNSLMRPCSESVSLNAGFGYSDLLCIICCRKVLLAKIPGFQD